MSLAGRLYHVGIVVPDVEAAQSHLADLLGVEWGPVLGPGELWVRDGNGVDRAFPNKLCYSTQAPHLELIEEVPGSVWECNEYSNLHHIGVFSDDLDEDSLRYTSLRCPLQACGVDNDIAPTAWAYHLDPLGIRIELVDVAVKPMMEEVMFKAPTL